MKSIAQFLGLVLFALPCVSVAAPVATTNGDNLTAYNPGSGASNNNTWNAMLNGRNTGASNAKVDFGNCNALIIRCAQPKCSGGGCTDMNVAASIVTGCVNASSECKKYGDDLVNYMSAQLVASSTAKINEAQIAAQNAAAQASAQANAQQMAMMQSQMQQMAEQNSYQLQQMQAALDEQKQLTADAIANANAARESAAATQTSTPAMTTSTNNGVPAATSGSELTAAQQIAAQNGVSADLIAREQMTGKIISSLENAETALKTLKVAMNETFSYAGCDSFGNNCSGPKRVSAFKSRAMKFFEPYETVLDELYDALVMAQSAGVDIADIYMMLNDSCNVWGMYLCNEGKDGLGKYDSSTCINGKSKYTPGVVIGNRNCSDGGYIQANDSPRCTLVNQYKDGETVQRDFIEYGISSGSDSDSTRGEVRVACASDALEGSIFRNRKKGASIDIEILERMINQDASSLAGFSLFGTKQTEENRLANAYSACAVGEGMYAELQRNVAAKKLPKKVCMKQSEALRMVKAESTLTNITASLERIMKCREEQEENTDSYKECICKKASSESESWKENKCNCGSGKILNIYSAECVDGKEYCAALDMKFVESDKECQSCSKAHTCGDKKTASFNKEKKDCECK
ncbi:MAG: hypothetical protein IJ560_02595 [Alphaproteobacteria bacterium]|nr:hypothetical protein [Alphaproteobacteria bacterium]